MLITVLSGPTAVGKTELAKLVGQVWPHVHRPVSYTTRPSKKGERNGVDYHFITREDFERRVSHGQFAEYAEVHGHLYGTSAFDLSLSDPDARVLLEIDVQGMRRIKSKFQNVATIFIHPPTFEELARRMANRNRGESECDMARRLKRAEEEIACAPEYDHQVVNHILLNTFQEVIRIMQKQGATV